LGTSPGFLVNSPFSTADQLLSSGTINLIGPVHSLYVHVPFCAQKCTYCAFYSEPNQGALANRYVSALIRELELVSDELKPETVFFGGGTPSLLNLRQWEAIFQAMEQFNLHGASEFTIECNPATISLDKAKLFRDHGVNRVSMGVQSLNEDLLDRLGRIHSRSMVFKSYDALRAAGFTNLNLDLMFAIPGQTLSQWLDTLREALALGSEHLSCYEVIYEEDTPLFHQLRAREFDVDEELACTMYEELISRAGAAGFQQYEVANFARGGNAQSSDLPQHACRHNVNYWRGGEYHGLGPSACGFVAGERTGNWSNTQLYCEQLEKGQRAIESREILPPLKRAGEIAAFGLRMNAGWPFAEFQQTTGVDLPSEWSAEMRVLEKRRWAQRGPDWFKLTQNGLRFADAAAEMFLR